MQIFTTGYEGATLQDFLQHLAAQAIELVVDIREAPISRKPGFSKSALGEALREAGIEYRHMRELGCPKLVRDHYRTDHDWDRYTRCFMKHLAEQAAAVDALAALAREQSTALLCYEADFNRCHRTYVARAVARANESVVCHITSAGVVIEATGSEHVWG